MTSAGEASGSTLRRRLEAWARGGVLAQVHALLVAMLRGNPTLILDSCSVRAKRAGNLTGPNRLTGHAGHQIPHRRHRDGMPVTRLASADNVKDTVVFARLFLAAFAVMVRILAVFADKGYGAEPTAPCATPLGPNRTSTSAVAHTARAWDGAAGRLSAATSNC